MALVEDDDALEVGLFTVPRQPGDDLFQPIDARLHTVPLAGLALQSVVAREADAVGSGDWPLARAEFEDEVGRAAEGRPVADGVAHEVAVLAHPEGAAAALEDVVEKDRRRGPAFPHAGPVSDEESLPRSRLLTVAREVLRVGRTRSGNGFELRVREDALGHEVLGQHRAVGARWCDGCRHRGRLDQARRVRARAWDPDVRTVGVEHRRCKRAGLGRLLDSCDRQPESVREGPRRRELRPRCHLRSRARWRGAQTGDAGCEEGEEVELFDLRFGRASGDVRCRRSHGISGWLDVRSL